MESNSFQLHYSIALWIFCRRTIVSWQRLARNMFISPLFFSFLGCTDQVSSRTMLLKGHYSLRVYDTDEKMKIMGDISSNSSLVLPGGISSMEYSRIHMQIASLIGLTQKECFYSGEILH